MVSNFILWCLSIICTPCRLTRKKLYVMMGTYFSSEGILLQQLENAWVANVKNAIKLMRNRYRVTNYNSNELMYSIYKLDSHSATLKKYVIDLLPPSSKESKKLQEMVNQIPRLEQINLCLKQEVDKLENKCRNLRQGICDLNKSFYTEQYLPELEVLRQSIQQTIYVNEQSYVDRIRYLEKQLKETKKLWCSNPDNIDTEHEHETIDKSSKELEEEQYYSLSIEEKENCQTTNFTFEPKDEEEAWNEFQTNLCENINYVVKQQVKKDFKLFYQNSQKVMKPKNNKKKDLEEEVIKTPNNYYSPQTSNCQEFYDPKNDFDRQNSTSSRNILEQNWNIEANHLNQNQEYKFNAHQNTEMYLNMDQDASATIPLLNDQVTIELEHRDDLDPYVFQALEDIVQIRNNTEVIKKQIEEFCVTRKNKMFLQLKEQLIRNNVKLDNVECEGHLVIRQRRKEVIDFVQETLDSLLNKAE